MSTRRASSAIPIVEWARRNGVAPGTARAWARAGHLTPFRRQQADGTPAPRGGIVDQAGADRWLRQRKARPLPGGSAEGLRHGPEARRQRAQQRRAEQRRAALEAAAAAGVGELARTVPDERLEQANARRAQLEADKVEIDVALQRGRLCVRADLLALVTDVFARLCRQLEGMPRLESDALIQAVQGSKPRIRRSQRQAVMEVLDAAIERHLAAAQDELRQLFETPPTS